MGLTAENLNSMAQLAELAAAPGRSRNEIYTAVALLFRVQGGELSERERALMSDILKRLTLDVEMAIRIALAERLADDPDAPLDLILLLANDAIEVARPIILRSRKFTDEQMLTFLAEASEAHQVACAERQHIGEPVTEVLARSEAEPVLMALIRNATARIAATTFEILMEKSRRLTALQEPLAQRSDFPISLAQQMCEWANAALTAHIVKSRGLDPDRLRPLLDQAARAVSAPPADGKDGGRKLIEKLAAAGQLKAGFLLRVLQQGQIDLFNLGFAKLLEMNENAFYEVFYRKGPTPVALACRSVGIDRCVFPTLYRLSREYKGLNPILSPDERGEIETIFDAFSRNDAKGVLVRMAP